ncbi:hypothetical protein FGO68_gene9408 [Halteria grandinella]|uniref:Uncharacterized protein n=1 Tax=Halteria grandinella TaxID=5974 RepID=A0A8J8NKK6_HALGN|nr:hypothetical protein FGO68_gene9408 [Halteria grandinella]
MRATLLAVTLAALGLVAQARLGLGPCPSLTKVDLSTVTLNNGRWYLNYADESQILANTIAFQPKPDCFAVDLTTTATGFHWEPLKILPALKDCKKDVRCGNPAGTCNCYVYAKPYDIVYFDNTANVAAFYQCWEIKSAFDTFVNNMGANFFTNSIAWLIKGIINDLHYTGIDVFSMSPVITGDALESLRTWANGLSDQVDPNYVPTSQGKKFAKQWGGYDGTPTYSFDNLNAIPQASCKRTTL